jgi:hypothetical protein
MTYLRNVDIKAQDSPSIDAFSRWRTSEPGNRLDVEFNYDLQEEIIDEVLGGAGTATHSANARHVTLANVATGTGDYAGLYSYDIPYTPGNSQLIAITGVLDKTDIGGGTAQIFVRSKVSGSVVESVTDQSSWDFPNNDVDWAFSQILEMDFQSLKVGRIRFYLNRGGVICPLHYIENDNVRSTGYWQTPNLPVYWRIYNDATYTYMEMGYGNTDNAIGIRYKIAKNATATMTAICATVKSEGGAELFDIPGYNRTADMGVTTKTVAASIIPLIAIRPRSTFNSIKNQALAIPIEFSIQTDNPIKVVLIHDCTLTGASWANVDTAQSVMEYDISASSYSNGHIVHSEYIATSKNTQKSDKGILGRNVLWYRRGTESGILLLAAVRTTSTSAATLASITWREIR